VSYLSFSKEEAWEASAGSLEVGLHAVKIAEAESGKSSGSHPQLELRFENDQGNGIRDWLVITEKSVGKFLQFTDSIGLEKPGDFETQDDFQAYLAQTARTIGGRRCVIRVGEEQDQQGEPRRRVQAYMPSDTDVPVSSPEPATVGSSDDLPF
jgi:hypothetical protein